MRVINLGSGSKGNSTLIEYKDTMILIDAGLPIKELEGRIVASKADLGKLSAIVVSHNHIDHIRSVSRIANRYNVPVYAARECYLDEKLNRVLYELKNEIGIEDFMIGDILVSAFEVPHDAFKTLGFTFSAGGNKISLVTDVGEITDNVFNKLIGSDLVMIESNYDEDMLTFGPYPEKLKRRIKSSMGHLSNTDCAKHILNLRKLGTKHFILMHLSEINNSPEIAYNNVMNCLYNEYGDDCSAKIYLAWQNKLSSNFILKSKTEEGQ